jgi:PQQ-like domain
MRQPTDWHTRASPPRADLWPALSNTSPHNISIASPPTVADNVLYVGAQNRHVYAMNASTGALLLIDECSLCIHGYLPQAFITIVRG